MDELGFERGIGENDGEVRASICEGLSWAGISLDDARNRASNCSINSMASRVLVQVLASQEDEQIARHTSALSRLSLPR